MKKQFFCCAFALIISCTQPQKKENETLKANEHNLVDEQIIKWRALNAYVGKYSKDTDFFENEFVKNELIKIMADDFKNYMKFVETAGYGIIEKVDNIIYCEVSMEHVGGFNSLLLIDTEKGQMYLFLLNGTVSEKDYKIYGKRPFPEAIKKIIENDMNTGWGHVAMSVWIKDSLLIN